MIKITDKRDCCGCSACVQRCPKHCISLKEDVEGFLYPHVNTDDCINCGLCEKVCPWLNRSGKLQPIEVLAVKNHDEKARLASSSGGVFIALAEKVIDKGGVVFGAVFDEKWEVKHSYAETIEDVRPMMGSKYLQSRIENSYCDAEKFLKDGRYVLFTGSPCQVAGLHSYLRKDYSNLLTVDFLCHGVPSPGVWRRYLEEELKHSARRSVAGKNTVLSSSLNVSPVITGIAFRDKNFSGWKKYSFVVRGKSASKAGKNTVLLSDIFYNNPYMKGFLSDLYLRPSCYRCKCKNGVSHSDLTIGDFWGVPSVMPDFDDDKGIGLVLINTDKGKVFFDMLDMEVRCTTLDAARIGNGGFNEHVIVHPKRRNFFSTHNNSLSVIENIDKNLQISPYLRFIRKTKKMSRILISKFVNKCE